MYACLRRNLYQEKKNGSEHASDSVNECLLAFYNVIKNALDEISSQQVRSNNKKLKKNTSRGLLTTARRKQLFYIKYKQS